MNFFKTNYEYQYGRIPATRVQAFTTAGRDAPVSNDKPNKNTLRVRGRAFRGFIPYATLRERFAPLQSLARQVALHCSVAALVLVLLFAACDQPSQNDSSLFAPPVPPAPVDYRPAAPAAPQLLPSDSFMTVRWNPVEGAQQYEVYIGTDRDAPPEAPSETTTEIVTVILNLENHTKYYVWLKTVNANGTSAYSAPAYGTPWPSNEAPEAPENVVVAAGMEKLNVRWDAAGGAANYDIYFSESSTPPSASAVTTEKTSALLSSLINNTIYYVWVKAVNSVGASDWSAMKVGMPKAPTTPPAAPEKPVLSAGNKRLTVSWQAVEMTAAYELWYGASSNQAAAAQYGDDIDGGESQTVITGLENGTAYYVWLRAKNSVGASGFSPVSSATPSAFAEAPSSTAAPTVTAAVAALAIQWTTVEGASVYEIWLGTSENYIFATKRVGDVSGTSTRLTGLSNDTTYYVWIKAKNNAGTGGFSPAASGTPSAFAVAPTTPAAPTVIIGNQQLSLIWNAVEGADVYEVWLGTSNNTASAAKRGSDMSDLSLVIDSLSNGTSYYIWLKAKNASGASGFSPAASGIPFTMTNPPSVPTAPTVSIGSTELMISWSAVAGASAYELWYGTTNSSGSATQSGGDINATSATITSLTNGTSYYVWLKAKNDAGTSSFSPMASGKPMGTMGAPTITAGDGYLAVSWSAVAGAEQYELYYGTSAAPTTLSATVSGTSTVITGLTGGTLYYVRLKAKNPTGTSAYGTAASGTPTINAGLYDGAIDTAHRVGSLNLSGAISYLSTNIVSGHNYFIVLESDESASPISLAYPGKTVGITLVGIGEERTISLSANGSLFTVGSGVTLTLDNNIMLVGRSDNTTSLVNVYSGGTLIMNDGSKITGNTNLTYGSANSGGVGVSSGGSFTMNGGTISGNSARYHGGGVYSSGTFTMNSGVISSNSTQYNGGGVYSVGTITMNGGTINSNTASTAGSGGGAYSYGIFIMSGGTISGNSAYNMGGGVYSSGTYTMNGGTISGNTNFFAGAVYIATRGIFKKTPPSGGSNSGIIYGPEATGTDTNGVPLKNANTSGSGGASVYYSPTLSKYRNTTANQTDHIDTTTGRGLSTSGTAPFGE
ncbi:MAG: fibronectin type III domain-containing protein [Spirochaetaceae bacterium]|jgi:fibronectin type 3 domain-containing protein|nr:fibronectin type III domain-containing protein [Spirochaetaceae bacterium]